jgi:RHS repeat-associated protein
METGLFKLLYLLSDRFGQQFDEYLIQNRTWLDPNTSLPIDRNLRSRVAAVYKYDCKRLQEQLEASTTTYPYTHATHYCYDIHGNVKDMVQDMPEFQAKRLQYDYDLISGKVNNFKYNWGYTDQLVHKYRYDADNRLTETKTSRDGVLWTTEARNKYYLHGALARVEIGQDNIQGLDYAYTLQGWTKAMNSGVANAAIPIAAAATRDIGGDGIKYDQLLYHQVFAPDAVGYQLDYFANDYKAAKQFTGTTATQYAFSAASMPTLAVTPTQSLYNGNIRQMRTSFHANLTVSNASGTFFAAADDGLFRYGYDQLNRLRVQKLWSTATATAATENDRFAMKFVYDANGNIRELTRYGEAAGAPNSSPTNTPSPPREMDALSYAYNAQNNQLNYVKDVANGGLPTAYPDDIENQELNNYTYDAIGNLIADASEGTRMRWNVGGKLFKVEKETQTALQTVNYEYDATGNRVLKEVINNQAGTTQRTYYTRDAQGNTLATYLVSISPQSSGLPNAKFEAWSLYGSSRLGEWKPSENGVGSGSISAGSVSEPNDPVFGEALAQPQPMTTPNWTNWVARRVVAERRYEISNHLGNVLATVLDRKTVTTGTTTTTTIAYNAAHLFRADIATATDYYAFGQPMPTRQYTASFAAAYRYGFNGKENDKSFDSKTIQDYGFRLYSPALCKFLSVDPLTKEYPELTPYQFASNTPIMAIDLDGLESLDYRILQTDTKYGEVLIQVSRTPGANHNQPLTIRNLDTGQEGMQSFKENELNVVFGINGTQCGSCELGWNPNSYAGPGQGVDFLYFKTSTRTLNQYDIVNIDAHPVKDMDNTMTNFTSIMMWVDIQQLPPPPAPTANPTQPQPIPPPTPTPIGNAFVLNISPNATYGSGRRINSRQSIQGAITSLTNNINASVTSDNMTNNQVRNIVVSVPSTYTNFVGIITQSLQTNYPNANIQVTPNPPTNDSGESTSVGVNYDY